MAPASFQRVLTPTVQEALASFCGSNVLRVKQSQAVAAASSLGTDQSTSRVQELKYIGIGISYCSQNGKNYRIPSCKLKHNVGTRVVAIYG